MSTEADARKAARANAAVRIVSEGEDASDADALYWDEIPVHERAEFVWRLSLELHELSKPTEPYEPGLSRSVVRILRG